MATTDPIILTLPGLKAGADLSSSQYKFVKLSAAGTVVACDGATDRPIGVLQNKPTSGQAATVVTIGVTKIQPDEALTVGSTIGTSSDAQAQIVAVGSETTVYIVGIVLQAAGTGELATALVNCAAPARAA